MKIFFNVVAFLISLTVSAQDQPDNFWKSVAEGEIKLSGKRQIIPQKYAVYHLAVNDLKVKLGYAPSDKSANINQSNCIITLPAPNGQSQLFRIIESSIMEASLQASFPDIKTYSIKGITDPYANGKIDVNEFGFHGMVRSITGDFFIDPYCLGNTEDYISYYVTDFEKPEQDRFSEVGVDTSTKFKRKTASVSSNLTVPPAASSGPNLRTYRLALACTGEYAVAATGSSTPTMAQTLSKIVTSINRVDGVYETEVAVRLVLAATETNVIFTNSSTDPFTGNNNASVLISESQSVITTNIGSSNFDIGHTFSTGGGGLAALGVVCDDTQKANGITGSSSPFGDPYDIDYVSHEMGHQFSADHTFNAITVSCGGNRTASTAVEPGSGVTIMAYAGICGPNDLASNSIAYFHAISYDQIVNYTTLGAGAGCGVTNTTGNQPPLVTGTGSYTVPVSTPFILKGTGTDPDGDVLTYSWEQIDIGPSGNWNSGSKPYFRSYVPSASNARSFPIVSSVLSNSYQTVKGEFLPSTAQTLNFRLTARDNKMGGGGVNYATSTVNVDATAGPFKVTYPTHIGWLMGSQQNITWDVKNTDVAPVNEASVNILISYDSGNSFTTFVANTPNDGMETITVPTFTADITTCRIKIEAITNIFYDISTPNFTIASSDVSVREVSGNNAMGLSVFPNPFNDEFNLRVGSLHSGSRTTIIITDVLGEKLKMVNYENISVLHETLSLSELDKGVYFITVINNQHQATARLIKK